MWPFTFSDIHLRHISLEIILLSICVRNYLSMRRCGGKHAMCTGHNWIYIYVLLHVCSRCWLQLNGDLPHLDRLSIPIDEMSTLGGNATETSFINIIRISIDNTRHLAQFIELPNVQNKLQYRRWYMNMPWERNTPLNVCIVRVEIDTTWLILICTI